MIFKKILSKMKRKFNPLAKRRIFAYKPYSIYISKKANVNIASFFNFNGDSKSYKKIKNTFCGQLFVDDYAELKVENFSAYSGTKINVYQNAKLYIGSGYINHNSTIDCYEKIVIGKNCVISENVKIRDSNNHEIMRTDYKIKNPICIKDNVWIGMNSIILPGVTIGAGSIIAAGSVVTKSVPPKTLVGGNPAHIIRTNINWRP